MMTKKPGKYGNETQIENDLLSTVNEGTLLCLYEGQGARNNTINDGINITYRWHLPYRPEKCMPWGREDSAAWQRPAGREARVMGKSRRVADSLKYGKWEANNAVAITNLSEAMTSIASPRESLCVWRSYGQWSPCDRNNPQIKEISYYRIETVEGAAII